MILSPLPGRTTALGQLRPPNGPVQPVEYDPRIGRSKVRWFRDGLRVAQRLAQRSLWHSPQKPLLAVTTVPLLAGVVSLFSWSHGGMATRVLRFSAALSLWARGMVAMVLSRDDPS